MSSTLEGKSFRRRMIYTVQMARRSVSFLICVSALVAVSLGFEVREPLVKRVAPTFEDCMMPPMRKQGHDCCRLPKERIWGDLRGSLNLCLKKIKQEPRQEFMRQENSYGKPETVTLEGSEMMTSTEDPFESASTMSTSPRFTTSEYPNQRRSTHWKKPLSERLKDLFASMYKEIKNTFNAIWQSVVIITDHLRQRSNDSCFMECVFEDQGFLLNKMVNKEALVRRLTNTLGRNEPWHKAAMTAVETCYMSGMQVPSNGTCQSGSEEIFRCVLRHIFLNCPNWLQNDYCTSLKEFYQKCPNGPPPEVNDDHTTSPTAASPEEDMETASTTESER